jgi:hypothetical protein
LVLGECPFCHKFFEAELVSREEIDATELAKEETALGEEAGKEKPPSISRGRAQWAPIGEPGSEHWPEFRAEARGLVDPRGIFLADRSRYRSKNCGKEWTKTSYKYAKVPEDFPADLTERD